MNNLHLSSSNYSFEVKYKRLRYVISLTNTSLGGMCGDLLVFWGLWTVSIGDEDVLDT